MNRSCPTCSLTPDSPDQTECARCGTALPLPPAGSNSAVGASTLADQGVSPAPGAPGGASSGLPADVRNWAMAAHLAAFSTFVIPIGFVIGPLVVWLIKRDHHPFIAEHGREALNFNLSVLIYGIVSAVLVLLIIGILMLVALAGLWIAFTIIAAVRAANGESYRYPLTIRFIN